MIRSPGFALLLVAVASGPVACGRQEQPPARSASRAPATQAPGDASSEDGSEWRIEPGRGAGALKPGGSEADLREAYGASQVRASRIELGEGDTAPGTILFPDDPDRRLQILWADSSARRAPERLILRGERSRWRLPRGISLGTSLAELEDKNGRPFTLAGFGWDYAGVIVSWNGGALDSTLSPDVKLYLEPRIEDRVGEAYRRVLGDRDYSSALPAMRSLNPRVYQIFVDWR